MTGRKRGLAAAVLIAAEVPCAAFAQQPGDGGWAEMRTCAAMANDDRRHRCMDDVLRRHGIFPAPEARAVETRRQFGLAKARLPEPPRTRPAEKPDTGPSDDRVTMTLARVDDRGDGKLRLTTTDGAVWQQTESSEVRPMPSAGQSMTVRKAGLGGFICTLGRYTSFRCARVR